MESHGHWYMNHLLISLPETFREALCSSDLIHQRISKLNWEHFHNHRPWTSNQIWKGKRTSMEVIMKSKRESTDSKPNTKDPKTLKSSQQKRCSTFSSSQKPWLLITWGTHPYWLTAQWNPKGKRTHYPVNTLNTIKSETETNPVCYPACTTLYHIHLPCPLLTRIKSLPRCVHSVAPLEM